MIANMLDDGLISIVVPVYGVEDYLEQCIDSLLSQRHKNVEIILVDDGSVDRSGEICDSYAALDRRTRVIHKPNGGLVSARKAGVAVATGDYLGFVDGDDWVDNDFFESLHDHAASASADLVISGHTREFLGKREVISPRNESGLYSRADILETLLPSAVYNGVFFQHGVSTYVWNKLFRRRKAAGLVDEINESIVMGEDAALTYCYLAESDRVVVCDSEGYFYRQRSNSIVKSVPSIEQEYRQLSELFRFLKQKFEEHERSECLLEQLRFYFYAQVLIRSGAVVEALDACERLIPFPQLTQGQRVVIYSSGSFGQHMVDAIRRLDGYRLVGWIDEDDQESQMFGLPVSSIDSVSLLDFDLVLVAAIDSEYSEVVAGRLETKGVSRAKISRLDVDFDQLDGHIQAAGFDTASFTYSSPV